MKSKRRNALVAAGLLALGGLSACGNSNAEADADAGKFPSEDITLVVGYEPGGGYDTWARALAPFIAEHLGGDINVVVRNVPGAGGLSAARQLYAAPTDGTEIHLMNITSIAAAEVGGEGMGEDLEDLTFLGRVASDPQVIYSAGKSDLDSVEDLKAVAPIKHAFPALTGGIHVVVAYDALGIDYSAVTHDGNDPARLSVIRGDTQTGSGSVDTAVEDFKAGVLKPILFVGDELPGEGEVGYKEMQGVQTVADLDHPELAALEYNRMLAGPPDLPGAIAGKLDDAIQAALADPDFVEQAKTSALSIDALDATDAEAAMQDQIELLETYQDAISDAMKSVD